MTGLSRNTDRFPDVLPGFGHLSRIWDSQHELCATKILPGEYYVTEHDEIITTVLGSCVSACVRDPITGVGGMNHFMLPGDTAESLTKWGGQDALETRYGIAAMENLINDILKQGARKNKLEVKLFGGGRILAMNVNDVGDRNISFAREFVRAEGLAIAAEDLGGPHPRKVNFFPKTGKVMIRRLRSVLKQRIAETEQQYAQSIGKQPDNDDIELFD